MATCGPPESPGGHYSPLELDSPASSFRRWLPPCGPEEKGSMPDHGFLGRSLRTPPWPRLLRVRLAARPLLPAPAGPRPHPPHPNSSERCKARPLLGDYSLGPIG